MSVEDSDRNIHFDSTFRIVGNDKGWRMSRANVFAREGSLYYEVKIMKGIPQDSTADAEPATSAHPHVRMGWARREAPLDAPVGFDGYSYGITDTRFDTMHRSRPGKFLPPSKSKPKSKKQQQQQPQQSSPDTPLEILRENDVIGLLITLPPLPLHRKVVAGTYNPAVDFSYAPDPNAPPPDIIRDRIPLIYRGAAYFEQNEYQPTRTMIQYSDRAPSNIVVDRPHPNHSESALRSLPGSSFVVYKNGIKAGTAFEGLLSFLPPASAPGNVQGARQGMDDGSLGYYPAVSVFSGGMAEVNLGPRFWCPPAELVLEGQDEPLQDVEMTDADGPGASAGAAPEIEDEYDLIMKPRAISARYFEQIAEDLVWDIVDEASFFALDGGYSNKKTDLLLTPGPDGVVPNE
jgi:COMPASS component BRE2